MSNFVSTLTCTYGFVLKIVSSSHTVEQVASALLSFVQHDVLSIVQAMSMDVIRAHAEALESKYLLPCVDLHDEAKNMWSEIENDRFAFQLHIKKAEWLRRQMRDEETQRGLIADLMVFCNYHLVCEDTRRVLIAVAECSHVNSAAVL